MGGEFHIYYPIFEPADEETIIASTKEITGGIDTAVDFVGTAATFNRAYQCAEKVC